VEQVHEEKFETAKNRTEERQMISSYKEIMKQNVLNLKKFKTYILSVDWNIIDSELLKMCQETKWEIIKFHYEEIIKMIKMGCETKTYLKTYGINGGISNKEEIIKLLINFAITNSLDYILLLDMEYFSRNNMLTDEKIAEEINMLIEECKKYDKSLIIYDFESICSVVKEYSQLKSDLKISSPIAYLGDDSDSSFTYRLTRPITFQTCLQHFESGK